MDFINNSKFPAIAFEGVDQLEQNFHVVVMRQTYTWNGKGLLELHDTQDSLCMEDTIIDRNDVMSGVIEESDLCHYKPKCDILVIGHAYTPATVDDDYFIANLHVQTPDKVLYSEPIRASKYLFAQKELPVSDKKNKQTISGQTLVDKSLYICAPIVAQRQAQGVMGHLRYQIKALALEHKVSLNPKSSFGGYCLIEQDDDRLSKIPEEVQLPIPNRENIRLNPQHGVLGYFNQDNYNPSGQGYISSDYAQAIQPNEIRLAQIYHPDCKLEAYHIDKMANGTLDAETHIKLVQGFGIRAKSHPERYKYLGKIDQALIASDRYMPEGFDFAIWNNAYPDQQVEQMVGNEWITLTNLCHPKTLAATSDQQSNTRLRLYLPEMVAYLLTNSNNSDYPESEVPMKLDTVIIRPDEQKVHLVWRGIVAGEYDPKTIMLETADRVKQQQIIEQYFTQKGEIIRPYED